MDIARLLIGLGGVLIVAGVVVYLLAKAGVGRLPGDLVLRGDGYSLYVPVVTCIVVSVVLSVVLWLLGR